MKFSQYYEGYKDQIKIAFQKTYSKHGCYFEGKLIVFDIMAISQYHPRHGEFGAQSSLDVAQDCKALVLQAYPTAESLLGVPDLVMRISDES